MIIVLFVGSNVFVSNLICLCKFVFLNDINYCGLICKEYEDICFLFQDNWYL